MGLFSTIFRPLAYLSLPVIFLRSVSAFSPKGQYFTRLVLYLYTVAGGATASLGIATTLRILGRPYDSNYYVARLFQTLVWRIMDLKVEVEGEEHLQNRPGIIMVNHQSMIDLVVVGMTMPKGTAIMVKEELRFSPVGIFLMIAGGVFINRGNNKGAVRSLNATTEAMKRHKFSLFLYPEGTRNLGPEADLLPFKKGGFYMAVNAGIPIIPVVTENYWHLYRPGFFGSGVIKVRVLPPVPTEGLSTPDVNDLVERVRGQMLETLREISLYARKPTVAEGKEIRSMSVSNLASEKEYRTLSGASIAINPSTQSAETDAGGPQSVESKGSSASLSSFATSSQLWKSTAGSEAGGETEEEDMVLVGRPGKQ